MALMSSGRYLLLIVLIVLSGHFLLSLTHDAYARATSWSWLRQPTLIPQDLGLVTLDVKSRAKANATFIILARNSDMDNAVRSMPRMEDRFNTRHPYPYVLLNDEPFTVQVRLLSLLLSLSSAALPLLVPPFPSTPRSAPSHYSFHATLSAFPSAALPLRPSSSPPHTTCHQPSPSAPSR
ncbi:glycolipid 2-alpha-mannosyltransferase-domain-containing protein [Mycena rebaudengoi]|nr:glycolipid 2-alpha-mannosyltransferase-domain-containing protein [Mycena rebaudengoi]